MIIIKDTFNKEIFDLISELWMSTGVGNPQRGDNFEVVNITLNNKGKILTAWENDRLVGTCWLTSDSRRLYLHHMAVHPDLQNMKIGHSLMQEAIKYGKACQLQMKLEVNEQNPMAIHLYKKYGFNFIEHYIPMIKREI
jgi:ribosomal protein S18 acetylase RimI-like enzyme